MKKIKIKEMFLDDNKDGSFTLVLVDEKDYSYIPAYYGEGMTRKVDFLKSEKKIDWNKYIN